jgi:uncharacterized membrane protein YbaN (DUF454 family)
MKRILYMTFGILCVVIGTIGIFFPILPTTPFLLLAAWLFSKSNEKFHHWLLNHPVHGQYIKDYLEKKAVKKRHRTKALILLWSGMALTIYLIGKPLVGIILASIAAIVTLHLLRLRVLSDEEVDLADSPSPTPSKDLQP